MMTTLRTTISSTAVRVFGLAPWCILVFGLVLVHLALMTSEHHSEGPAAPHAGTLTIDALAATTTMLATHDARGHDTPRSTLDGCPVGQALLPLLFLLFGLIWAYGARTTANVIAASRPVRRAPPAAPLPLPAGQRRALLQIFII